MSVLRRLNAKDRTVLVVEDNPDDARIVGKAVENFGIGRLVVAATAEDAIEILAKQNCDVIVTDYNLPGMDGLRLLERIREKWPDVPVILVTGAQDDQVAASAIKLGASDYLPKDDLLTSGVFRSLQATLRERAETSEEELRGSVAGGGYSSETACAEGRWLLQSLAPFAHAEGALIPEYGSERWPDAMAHFTRYLIACSERLAVEPMEEETSLVRMFLEQGTSPREVVMLYEASLRGLRAENTQLRCSPANFLARLLAHLVEEYQRQASNAAIEGAV